MALPAQQRQKPRRDTAEECLLVIAFSMLGLRSRAMRARPSVCKSGKDEVVALNVGLVARNAGLALSLADRSSRDPRCPLNVDSRRSIARDECACRVAPRRPPRRLRCVNVSASPVPHLPIE